MSERCRLFWLSCAQIRTLVICHWGYDPNFMNVDQSPFHMNEVGSCGGDTIVMMGAPTVPLVENHAATRARWSLNSVTLSDKAAILRCLPSMELMFNAASHGQVTKQLNDHIAEKK